ncbi:hypothetical protein BD289DRAFT_448068 [Coniella lustricola]|uniref:NAD(P)-binding domain-containing protein n=1 Tax=Coniella lustricola TaxID=2025994 RepID=A0A2T2ZSG7_9PEZI|nr:hypothetical protein BD289DRAFT_448068 [Coniella lustricola]
MAQKTLFLIGPGLVGGSLLVKLKQVRPDLALHALTRRDDQAAELRSIGVTPIRGTVTDTALIKDWVAKADIVLHCASADDADGTSAILEALLARPHDHPRRAIYIQLSGNDELVHSAKGLGGRSIAERTLSDLHLSDAQLEQRIQPDAYHRHVDGKLRRELANPAAEKAHNVVTCIMMPPLIYGVGAEPWRKISIQTPMLAGYMMDKGLATLPEGHDGAWNCVWVHDLVEQYVLTIQHLETVEPGDETRTHYVFPAEAQPFSWKEHFDAVAGEIKRLGHPAAAKNGGKPIVLQSEDEFREFVGGKDNGYSECFGYLVWSKENSYTSPE